jgi:hypothetical protein
VGGFTAQLRLLEDSSLICGYERFPPELRLWEIPFQTEVVGGFLEAAMVVGGFPNRLGFPTEVRLWEDSQLKLSLWEDSLRSEAVEGFLTDSLWIRSSPELRPVNKARAVFAAVGPPYTDVSRGLLPPCATIDFYQLTNRGEGGEGG